MKALPRSSPALGWPIARCHTALAALALAVVGGCAGGDREGQARGALVVEGRGNLSSTSQSLSLAALQELFGTYGAGCTARAGAWSLPLSGYAGAIDNPLLSVVSDDTTCVLTVTGVKASGVKYTAGPVMPLFTSFAPMASAFQVPGGVLVASLAGSGNWGAADGAGSAAEFSSLAGLAVDAAGNVFVADQSNHTIRKISPTGVVSTLAGGAFGFADGTGSQAQFASPSAVAVDAAGNVFVADAENHALRKVTTAGVVTTVAGNGTFGFADGPGAAARFFYPTDVVVDAGGNLFVTDGYNHRVRKVTPAGEVSTLAGDGTAGLADGPGASAKFDSPWGLALAANGDLVVADRANHRIRKVTPAGVVSTVAGSSYGAADGTSAQAQFASPVDVAVDASGQIVVADFDNHRLRRITPAGVVSTLVGDGSGFADGLGDDALLNAPSSVGFGPTGKLYFADQGNYRVRTLTQGGAGELFYGNAKIDTATFASSFVIDLLVSDQPSQITGSKTATYASSAGTAQSDLVAPPNYTFDLSTLSVAVDVDKVVTSTTGGLTLASGGRDASGYVVDPGTLPNAPTFTDFDAAYLAGAEVAVSSVNPLVPASALLSVGTKLPTVRTVLLRRSQSGVVAYQAIKITFQGP